MTKEEAIKRLSEFREWDDPEAAHVEADDILLEYLDSNGHKEVADAWKAVHSLVGFWYA